MTAVDGRYLLKKKPICSFSWSAQIHRGVHHFDPEWLSTAKTLACGESVATPVQQSSGRCRFAVFHAPSFSWLSSHGRNTPPFGAATDQPLHGYAAVCSWSSCLNLDAFAALPGGSLMWCHAALRNLNRLLLERADAHTFFANQLSCSRVCDLNGHCWAFSDLSLVKSSSWLSHLVPWCATLMKPPSHCKTQAISGTRSFTFITRLSCGHNDFQHRRKICDAKHPLLSLAKTLLYLLC